MALRRSPRLLVWLICLVVFLFAGALSYSPPLERLENLTGDWRFQIRGTRRALAPITIIAIDQETLDSRDVPPLVFWGERHARVLRILREAGAKAIGFDIVQPLSLGNSNYFDPSRPDPDQIQAQEIAATPQLVLAFSRHILPSGKVSETLPNDSFLTALTLGGGGLGFGNTTPDSDGIVRSFLPVDKDEKGEITPSFVLEIARIALAKEPKFADNALMLGARRVALNGKGQCLIDYAGRDATFPRISYRDLLARPGAFKKQLENRICLVGTTSYELQDFHGVPFPSRQRGSGPIMAGVEVNANMIATLLAGGIWRGGAIVTWSCILAMVALSGFCCSRWSVPRAIAGLGFLLASWTALCALAFSNYGWQLPLVAGILALSLNGFCIVTARWREESARKRRVEGMFGRYVSTPVLKHLMNTPGATELGGRRQSVTVLFSDIRGFTSRSEQMEPEQVTQFLNLYLEKMVEVVFAHGGTIDKYMGDGIMAVWNWPDAQSDHARRATRAALQMQREIEGCSAQWQEMGFPILCVGVGIHTGNAVVGNIGSPLRMEPTTIGDTVNVASRLESLTKELSQSLGSSILISEAVRDAIQQGENGELEFAFLPAGESVIRGRTEGLKLYAIISEKSEKLQENTSC